MEAVLRGAAGRDGHDADGGPARAFSEEVRRVPRPRGSRSNSLARLPGAPSVPGRAVARHSAPERRAALEQAPDALRAALRAGPRRHADPERLAARPRGHARPSVACRAAQATARGAPGVGDRDPGPHAGRVGAAAGGADASRRHKGPGPSKAVRGARKVFLDPRGRDDAAGAPSWFFWAARVPPDGTRGHGRPGPDPAETSSKGV